MDCMQDVLADGRRVRTLHVLAIGTRACLAMEVDTALPGKRVVRLLDHLLLWHGAPKQITLDNGPEFTGQALEVWAYAHSVTLDFIEPGKPTQNGYLESFTGKFRDECLNIPWVRSLADARQIIEECRDTYNTQRPHSALGGRTPTQHAEYYQQAGSLA
jgi:putative transposase